MKRVILKRSHAVIGFYILMAVLCLGVSEIVSNIEADIRSKELYFITLRYWLPAFLLVLIIYEFYIMITGKRYIVMDDNSIFDDSRKMVARKWSEIEKVHMISNFGIYQIHVYLKGKKNPVRLGPVRIKKDQELHLKENLCVPVLWS